MSETYKTDELPAAAYLVCREFKLIEIDKTNRSKGVFIFEESDELHEAMDEFWGYEARIDPLDFYHKIRELKARVSN